MESVCAFPPRKTFLSSSTQETWSEVNWKEPSLRLIAGRHSTPPSSMGSGAVSGQRGPQRPPNNHRPTRSIRLRSPRRPPPRQVRLCRARAQQEIALNLINQTRSPKCQLRQPQFPRQFPSKQAATSPSAETSWTFRRRDHRQQRPPHLVNNFFLCKAPPKLFASRAARQIRQINFRSSHPQQVLIKPPGARFPSDRPRESDRRPTISCSRWRSLPPR